MEIVTIGLAPLASMTHVMCDIRRWQGPGQAGHVELFMCPKASGQARVFLFNAAEWLLPDTTAAEKKTSFLSILMKPASWKARLKKMIIGKMYDPRRVAGHMISHSIFDGDGIFLHKQGNRMQKAGLSFKDYSTPSSSDVLLNAYRRFLDKAASITRAATGTVIDRMADAVVGSSN
jgi:Pheophorbide a oxygenase